MYLFFRISLRERNHISKILCCYSIPFSPKKQPLLNAAVLLYALLPEDFSRFIFAELLFYGAQSYIAKFNFAMTIHCKLIKLSATFPIIMKDCSPFSEKNQCRQGMAGQLISRTGIGQPPGCAPAGSLKSNGSNHPWKQNRDNPSQPETGPPRWRSGRGWKSVRAAGPV